MPHHPDPWPHSLELVGYLAAGLMLSGAVIFALAAAILDIFQ